MASKKTKVIEYLFFQHWDKGKRSLRKSIFSLGEVQAAIEHCNREFGQKLSSRNPANFIKDIVRGRNASQNWPKSLTALRYTAAQRTGSGDVFEFVRFRDDQTEPFPDTYKPSQQTPRYIVQSLSLPLAAKELGRSDEAWLIQTAVNLRIVETYFATVSRLPVIQITHLQMSVKLRNTEIDAVFLATCEQDDYRFQAIITCEAKRPAERILEDQIVNQAKAALKTTNTDLVVPIALRAITGEGIFLVEFAAVDHETGQEFERPNLENSAIFLLEPPVPGI